MPFEPNNKAAGKPRDERASSFLYVRVRPEEKGRWIQAARSAGVKLAEWVKTTLNGKAGE